MNNAIADRWRKAIERRLEFLGVGIGQAIDHLQSVLDTRWFKRFMDGTTDIITRRQKEEIALAMGPNWRARGQKYPVESLQYFDDDELLSLLSIDPKPSNY